MLLAGGPARSKFTSAAVAVAPDLPFSALSARQSASVVRAWESDYCTENKLWLEARTKVSNNLPILSEKLLSKSMKKLLSVIKLVKIVKSKVILKANLVQHFKRIF